MIIYFHSNSRNRSSGQSGLGKSTLVNTIFASHLIESKGRVACDEPPRQTTEIETVGHSMYSFDPASLSKNAIYDN